MKVVTMNDNNIVSKRPSHTKCYAKDCNHRKNTHDCVFSVFPTNYKRCRKWLKAVGIKDLVGLPVKKLSTIRFICSCHFKPGEYHLTKSGKRLSKDAIPSLFSPNTVPLSELELQDFSCKPSLAIVHTSKLEVPIANIEHSSEYSFHKMFEKLTDQQHGEQLQGFQKSQPCELSSSLEEFNSSRKRTISRLKPIIEEDEAISKPPSPKKICLIENSNSTSDFNTDQHCQLSMGDVEAHKKSEKQKSIRPTDAVERNTKKLILEQSGLKGVSISPDIEKLLSVIQKERREKSQLQNKVFKQQEVINCLVCNDSRSIDRSIESPALKQIANMEKNNSLCKKPQGHRYSPEQKLLSLSMAKHGNYSYKNLRSLMPSLPSKRTNNRLLQKFPVKPGINENLMHGIKMSARNLAPEDKYAMLIMDETKLKKRLLFTPDSSSVTGFATDSSGKRTPEIAGSVLVCMVISINSSFKQPICYHFSQSGFNSDGLKKIIVQTIKDIVSADLYVVGVVADQGKANKTALESLRNDTEGGRLGMFFKIEGYDLKIFILFDIAHLIKTSRNCFMGDWADWWRKLSDEEKNKWLYEGNVIECNGKKAYWRDIMDAYCYAINNNEVTRLTEEHIFPSSKNKMKVCFASQVFSQKLSAELKALAEKFPDKYPTARETADVIEIFDFAFDHMNGSNIKKKDKKVDTSRRNVSATSGHLKIWIELYNIFQGMKFKYGSNKKLKEGHNRTIQTPTPQAILDNLIALIGLSSYLLKEGGLKEFNLRNMTQDQLENFFGLIRHEQGDNDNLCCSHFENVWKTLLLTRYSHLNLTNQNSEDHMKENLVNLDYLITQNCVNQNKNEILTQIENGLTVSRRNSSTHPLPIKNTTECNSKNDNINSEGHQISSPTIHIADGEFDADCDFFGILSTTTSRGLNSATIKDVSLKRLRKKVLCSFCDNFVFLNNDDGTVNKQKLSPEMSRFIDEATNLFNQHISPSLHEEEIYEQAVDLLNVFFEEKWIECNENGHSKSLKDHIIRILVIVLIESECFRRNGELKPSELRAASASKIAQLKSQAK